jgi:DNA repair exonuclease SbcCD ATPase subunit
LINQVQDLKTRLEQENLRAAALQKELDSTLANAESEQKRLTALWNEERARVQAEERDGKNRLSAAKRKFDQERKGMQDELERLQGAVSGLTLERETLLGRLTEMTNESSKLALQWDEFRTSHQNAEERWGTQLASLNQALQQSKQDIHELRTELDKREADHLGELAALQQERETALLEAAAARKDLETLRDASKQERLGLTSELEGLRRQLLKSDSEKGTALPTEVARLSEFAKKIETLEAELIRQGTSQSDTKRPKRGIGGSLRGLWSRPATTLEDSHNDEPAPERRLRALWTEVMSERERMIHQSANVMRADLEKRLTDLNGQLATALERTVQLEAELEATRRFAAAKEGVEP